MGEGAGGFSHWLMMAAGGRGMREKRKGHFSFCGETLLHYLSSPFPLFQGMQDALALLEFQFPLFQGMQDALALLEFQFPLFEGMQDALATLECTFSSL
ncbi:hypothetical protein MM300_12860 [Evansella sp. LMS18]|uniref:hypothetical protein n=1 Tax=Evansella sp. LMS18 TaxID=2924033 RepID=UPI0020D0E79D|nr:hypothetical protein [Evansella sp. LMS18]UTR08828.1 hypothetical protein MM300_12860 [Evansella sp. LMS18]